mgnify:CR=1 FL=1
MAIEISTNWAYDNEGHFYYLTTAGAEEYTGYDVSTAWHNSDKRLYKQGQILHEWLTNSAYNGKQPRYRHRDIIEYQIFLNSNDEQRNIIRMLTELVEATYDTDWDRIMYEEDGSYRMPPSVISIGRNSGLLFKGEVHYVVPEDEYRVGY